VARVLGLASPFDPAIGKLTGHQIRVILDNSLTAEDTKEQANQLMTDALSSDIERIAQMDEEDRNKSLTIHLPSSGDNENSSDQDELWVQ
jgi:hypothetical protein